MYTIIGVVVVVVVVIFLVANVGVMERQNGKEVSWAWGCLTLFLGDVLMSNFFKFFSFVAIVFVNVDSMFDFLFKKGIFMP